MSISNNVQNPPGLPKSSRRRRLTPFSVPPTTLGYRWAVYINPICVLLALTKPGIAFSSDQLRFFPILEKDIHSIYTGNETGGSFRQWGQKVSFKAPFPLSTSFLAKYCVDLTATAADRLYPDHQP